MNKKLNDLIGTQKTSGACWSSEPVIPFVIRLSLDWIGWDLHSQSYNEFPDPYQSV